MQTSRRPSALCPSSRHTKCSFLLIWHFCFSAASFQSGTDPAPGEKNGSFLKLRAAGPGHSMQIMRQVMLSGMDGSLSGGQRGGGGGRSSQSASQPLSPGNYAKFCVSVCQPGGEDGRFAVAAPLFRFGSSHVAWLQKLLQ